ncbi:hypothetical protein QOT17_009686 [Balamuthia mandrillaris]
MLFFVIFFCTISSFLRSLSRLEPEGHFSVRVTPEESSYQLRKEAKLKALENVLVRRKLKFLQQLQTM